MRIRGPFAVAAHLLTCGFGALHDVLRPWSSRPGDHSCASRSTLVTPESLPSHRRVRMRSTVSKAGVEDAAWRHNRTRDRVHLAGTKSPWAVLSPCEPRKTVRSEFRRVPSRIITHSRDARCEGSSFVHSDGSFGPQVALTLLPLAMLVRVVTGAPALTGRQRASQMTKSGISG